MSSAEPDLLIVGAGLAGLSCAVHARQAGLHSLVLDSSSRPGGRVATDRVEGFLLDRGFQVLLDSYPEVQRLDLAGQLSLRPFEPGALIAAGGKLQRMSDPWRRPLGALASALSSCGTWSDKLALAAWRKRAVTAGAAAAAELPELSARERLAELGIGEGLVDVFFRPFFGGVFLDLELSTSSRMLDFLFPLFAAGSACLPRGGMAALPRALASRLPADCLRLGVEVRSVAGGRVVLADGQILTAPAVVVATEADTAARLLGRPAPAAGWRSAACVSFAAERDPVGEPTLVLDGEGSGPITNLSVPSTVNADYAPPGASLVSAAIVGDPGMTDLDLEAAVRRQARGWFGRQVSSWRVLRVDRIPRALPASPVGSLTPWQRPVEFGEALFACGDWLTNPSIDGALASGRRAARAVLQGLRSAA